MKENYNLLMNGKSLNSGLIVYQSIKSNSKIFIIGFDVSEIVFRMDWWRVVERNFDVETLHEWFIRQKKTFSTIASYAKRYKWIIFTEFNFTLTFFVPIGVAMPVMPLTENFHVFLLNMNIQIHGQSISCVTNTTTWWAWHDGHDCII